MVALNFLKDYFKDMTDFKKQLVRPFVVFYYLVLRIIKCFKFYQYKRNIIKNGRVTTYSETFKAKTRREREGFFDKFCQGQGLDIGYGGDLVHENAFGYDIEHGDATYLKILKNEKFDFIYTSHLIEHLNNPELAIKNWWKVLKPQGFLILYLPHRDLYEKKNKLPSNFNKDHKFFYLLGSEEYPDTKDILKVIEQAITNYEIVYAKICDDDYASNGLIMPSTGEYSIEIIIQKKYV